MFARITDFYVYMYGFVGLCVCVCVLVCVCTQTPACLSVCGCKKIDLGSVTAGPAGMKGLNGCLSQ